MKKNIFLAKAKDGKLDFGSEVNQARLRMCLFQPLWMRDFIQNIIKNLMNKDQIKEEFEKKFEYAQWISGKHNRYEDVIDFLAHLSAQYEKLIEEVMPKDCIVHNFSSTYDSDLISKGYNACIEEIRTSLQERGIKIK